MGMLGTILEYARHPLIPSFGLAHYPSKGGDLLAALRLLLMTGLRRMEALALRRDWIDARNQCIRFFFQAEDGIRDLYVTGVQTCALPIYLRPGVQSRGQSRSPAAAG